MSERTDTERPRGRCRAACRITCGGVGPGCIQKHLDQSIKVSLGSFLGCHWSSSKPSDFEHVYSPYILLGVVCVLWCAFCTAGECSWLLAIRGAMDVAVAFLPYLSWLHILAYIPPPWLSLFLIVSLDPSAVSSFALPARGASSTPSSLFS